VDPKPKSAKPLPMTPFSEIDYSEIPEKNRMFKLWMDINDYSKASELNEFFKNKYLWNENAQIVMDM
jgi:hypothetical protein